MNVLPGLGIKCRGFLPPCQFRVVIGKLSARLRKRRSQVVYKKIVLFILLQGALLVGVLGAPVVAALELGDRVDNFR